jgi:Tfp pilus assembly protein PilF
VPRSYVVACAAAVVLAALGVVAWKYRHPAEDGDTGPRPRQPFHSPFLNVAPGVAYVGDRACAACHPTESTDYRHHPMGRSILPVADVAAVEDYGKRANNPFDALALRFTVEPRGGKVYHKSTRLDAHGRAVAEHEDEVEYAFGSRARGCDYLVNRDGYLFQSPISWFTQKHTWALSPGFDASLTAGRFVPGVCLYCHTNHVNPVKDTENRYQLPLFDRGTAIGCERCHGPGGLHVEKQWQRPSTGADDTIVNPARLPPELREAVCQQCHLIGTRRVLRRGRDLFDYRPGLPLHDYWSVFVPAEKLTDDFKAVGQVEQMYSSRCFRASGGKLGCVSCHDAHGLPGPAQRIKFFRSRCLQCHQDTSCRLPKHDRLARSKGDSCIDCHMPRFRMSDIAHTAGTDHRILRKPALDLPRPPARLGPGELAIVNFYRDRLGPHDTGADRDLGIALSEYGWIEPEHREQSAAAALPLLERAVEADPDDVAAWHGRGEALWQLGRRGEALGAMEVALSRAPEREATLRAAATYAEQLGEDDGAAAYWDRLLAVDPWRPGDHVHRGELAAKHQDWARAQEEAQQVLQLRPADVRARKLLIRCRLRGGDLERARGEFEILLSMQPADVRELRRWFDAEQAAP